MKGKARVCLLIGLILSTICYALYTVVSLIGMFGIFGILTSGDAILNMAGFIYLGIMLLVFIFCLLGLILYERNKIMKLYHVSHTPNLKMLDTSGYGTRI